MPDKVQIPEEMTEAVILVETGWPPSELDKAAEATVQRVMLYKAIKNVCEYGGNLQ